MEFKVNREHFLEALAKTQGVVERKNTMPILANVLLSATKENLKITATDLEVALVTTLEAQVANPGRMTVHAKSLHDIVREITNPEIKLTLKENDRIEIESGSSRFVIPGLSANEFPSLPEVSSKPVKIPSALVLEMIQKTSFSMSLDETRLNLAGILLQQENPGKLKMVATDGHRLALTEKDLPEGDFGSLKVIIPRKGVNELRKLVSREGSFDLAFGGKNLFAHNGRETLFIRLIDGEFPDYRRVIPDQNPRLVVAPKQALVGALRRVSLLSNERSRGVVFNMSSGHLEVSISNPDLGEAREEFEVDYKGENIKIGFNARYFLDVLDVVKSEQVSLSLNSELSPCVVKEVGDDAFLSVIMPMRI